MVNNKISMENIAKVKTGLAGQVVPPMKEAHDMLLIMYSYPLLSHCINMASP